jgi:predicted nucleic acid-binding protein
MGQSYLMNTNVIIDHLGGKLPAKGISFLNKLSPVISIITKIELLGWYNAPPKQLKAIAQFIDIATVLPVSESIVNETISIKQSKKIKLPDAVIASTALLHNLILITRNIADFTGVKGLETINVHSL